jgi:hypothetical protein
MIKDNQSYNRDEWLASFTDQVLVGEADASPMDGSDSDTRALAETIVRLHSAYPKREPDPVMLKRIQSQVLKQWRIEEEKKARRPAFLREDWLSFFRRPQFALAVAALAIIGIIVLAGPTVITGGEVSGTAGASSIVTWTLFALLVIAAFWYSRRKK